MLYVMYTVIFMCLSIKFQAISTEQPCRIPCRKFEKYNGESPIVLQLKKNINIGYHPDHQILLIANLKDNLIFVPNDNTLFVINSTKNTYLIFDQKTEYAALKNDTEFNINHSDYSEFFESFAIIKQNNTIDSNSGDSFNYKSLIRKFFTKKFKLKWILPKNSSKLIDDLEDTFKTFLNLTESKIRDRSIGPYRGIWNFIAVSMGLKLDLPYHILDVFRLSTVHFGGIPDVIAIDMVRQMANKVINFQNFSMRIEDFVTCNANANINQTLKWISNVNKTPIKIKLPVENSTYSFKFSSIKNIDLLRLKLKAHPSNHKADIMLIFTNDVMLVINKYMGVVVGFYQKSFILCSFLSPYIIIGNQENSIISSFHGNKNLSIYLEENQITKAVSYIIETLSKYKVNKTIDFKDIYDAVDNAQIERIASMLKVPNTDLFLASYQNFFEQSRDETFGGITVGVLGNEKTPLASAFKIAVNGIVTTDGNWTTFTDFAFETSLIDLRTDYRRKSKNDGR